MVISSRASVDREPSAKRQERRQNVAGPERAGPAPALRFNASLLVERHDLLGELREVLDAVLVRGMRGQELWRRARTRELGHLLPEGNGGARIVAGARGQLEDRKSTRLNSSH